MYFHRFKAVSKTTQNEKEAQCQREAGRLSCFMKAWRILHSPHIWRSTLASPDHFRGPTTFPPDPFPCCMEPKGCLLLFPSLPPHFVLTGTMEKELNCNKTFTSQICISTFPKLPSRFSNEVGEQCVFSVPGRILPLADVFLDRIFCWVCFFFSFQASGRWLTSLISSGNSPAPVLPSWTTPQPQYGAVSELSGAKLSHLFRMIN